MGNIKQYFPKFSNKYTDKVDLKKQSDKGLHCNVCHSICFFSVALLYTFFVKCNYRI